MRWLIALLLFSAASGLTSCTTLPESLEIEASPGATRQCRQLVREIPSTNAVATLDRFSDLVSTNCDQEAIRLGRWIRENYREKTYSVARETVSVLMPEDAISEYVLESYERAYLSYVLAGLEYENGDVDAAKVELRRGYREGKALLYNYGEDPVNLILLATLWESLEEPDTARPFWLRASKKQETPDPLKKFATKQVERIDKNEKRTWQVQRLGTMPELDWNTRFGGDRGNGFYDIYPTTKLPAACASETGAIIPTDAWIDKISYRHAKDYHPLLNAKTWVRFPIGFLYGTTAVAGGLAVAGAGCAAASDSSNGGGELCAESIKIGLVLASTAGDITTYAIRPDLRHWNKVPSGFRITTEEDFSTETCRAPSPQ